MLIKSIFLHKRALKLLRVILNPVIISFEQITKKVSLLCIELDDKPRKQWKTGVMGVKIVLFLLTFKPKIVYCFI